VFQILIFTVVCVIVVYACIAFRDDRPVIDPWNDTFKQCDQTHLGRGTIKLADNENPAKVSADKFEPAMTGSSLPLRVICFEQRTPACQ
jgi:hypothetical protein